MTLTVDALRGYVETSLRDDALGELLEAAYEAIDGFAGVSGPVTELISPGPGDLLMLSVPAESVTSVTECDVILASDDYELIGGQQLHRLHAGTHPSSRWRGRTKVVYPRLNDDAERDRVAAALVALDVNHNPGLSAQQLGDWSETYADNSAMNYTLERQSILASLTQGFIAR